MGNAPPVFDILYWSNDSTRLPGAFHRELIDIFADNLLVKPGAMKVLGTPIDLSKVTCDKMFIAGTTDHITPWKDVYDSAQAFGGKTEFVLATAAISRA
jgi:polyhydroxyalkanoate synthase